MAVDASQEAELERRLLAYNREHAALWEQNHDDRIEAAPLHIFVRDGSGRLIGGLIARTHAIRCWLEVLVLWVDESSRGAGIGRKLMEQAEDEARRRGCSFARLASSDYQAPGFYVTLGYAAYGRLDDCPLGDTAHYFCKRLT
jgi:GNAT superfamily N-acetyltransferase